MKLSILATTQRVVLLAIVVLLEVSLEPLAEFEVVKITALNELAYINVSLDTISIKGCLEDFVVFNIFVFMLSTPFHSLERESVRIK